MVMIIVMVHDHDSWLWLWAWSWSWSTLVLVSYLCTSGSGEVNVNVNFYLLRTTTTLMIIFHAINKYKTVICKETKYLRSATTAPALEPAQFVVFQQGYRLFSSSSPAPELLRRVVEWVEERSQRELELF
jgi:hypothetical protein